MNNLEREQKLKRELIVNFDRFINKINMENHENEYLKELLGEEQYKNISDITLTECHVIDCIERNPLINAIGISQKMNITKGGISKISSKLLKKKLIKIYRQEGNKKEIFYSLTPLGREVFLVHEKLHEKLYQRANLFLDRFTDEELKKIIEFISGLSEII
ncbi:MarR family transcriptional regulator [Desulfosporosinus hippei]|uniref:DNA-binding transcriptional regulator, MarR family n=1 Tax=Desulfosporosinus hippei DSM 8344 TaxID=1121419 RepID=A0A1G7VDG7_9FIRM|nr:MarR family transcriptional regulator [Desulfosporosinus hippei]SDG57885.1 DNA-binding transcriptional regulator, MarR family [Desulfosporosinus hippei DSM 8344]